MTTDATARALVEDLWRVARIRGYGIEGMAAQALTTALDRIRDLEAALRDCLPLVQEARCFTTEQDRKCHRCDLVTRIDAALTPRQEPTS